MHFKAICNLGLLLLLFFSNEIASQNLIPYLSNSGLYGYADTTGKVIIQPQFNEAPFFDSTGTAMVMTTKYEKKVLLKNATLLPINSPVFQGNPKNITNISGNIQNAIPDLYYFTSSKEYLLFNKQTGKYKLTLQYKSNTDWKGFDQNANNPQKLNNFYQGFKRIIKETGVNFIDVNLNEVFKTDFDEGVNAGGGYFILRKDGKMGVMDKKSNIVVPFDFKSIGSTMKEDVFILNYKDYYNMEDTIKPSIYFVKNKKKMSLPYEMIKAVDDVLLVQSNGKQGLVDYSGKTILHCKYQWVNQLSTSNPEMINKFIFSQKDTAILVNSIGNILTDEYFKDLKYYFFKYKPMNQADWEYYDLFIGETRSKRFGNTGIRVLDKDLKLVFYDTLHSNLRPNINNFGKFYFSTDKSTSKSGIVDENGKILIPAKYDNVDLAEGLSFIVKLDNLFGLIGLDGKEILPCKYEKIQIEHNYKSKSSIAWAKEHSQNLFYAFGMDGKPLNIRPFIYPTLYEFRPTFPSNKFENGKYFSKTRSGVDVESEIINNYNIVKSGNEYLYYKTVGTYIDLRNENFERIIPKGFRAVIAYNTMGSGLFVVETGDYYDEFSHRSEIKVMEDEAPRPAPKPFDPDDPPMVEEVATERVNHDDIPPPELVDVETVYDTKKEGVINTKGEWIMPAVAEAHYTVINKYLIQQKFESYRKQDNFVLHRLANTKAPKIENLSRIQPSKKSISLIFKYLPRKEGGLEEFGCLIDSLGNELTPFKLVKIDSYHEMGDTLVVKIRKDNGENETAFMDFNGKILWKIADFDIKELDKKNNRMIVRNEEEGYRSLVDLKGNLVVKQKFKELDFRRVEDKLFYIGMDAKGQKSFFNETGLNIIVPPQYDSLISISNSSIHQFANGELMIYSSTYFNGKQKGFSMLYSDSGKLLKVYNARYQFDRVKEKLPFLLFNSNTNSRQYYINKETGQEYAE